MPGLDHDKKDILRRAVQSALAAALAYLAVQATGTGEPFLAVISAVLVLQNDRDETLGSARSRVAGTVVGTIVGAAALAVASDATTPISLARVMLVMGGLAAWKPDWRYGIVAAAGLAVGSDKGFWETAQDRGIAIFVGAAIGILVGSLIWAESARARARRQIAEAISLCRELLDAALSTALQTGEAELRDLHSRFARALQAARDTAEAIRLDKDGEHFEEAVHRVERLWHALIIIDRVTETQQNEALPLADDLLATVRRVQQSACDGLSCLERFEHIPDQDLDGLADACSEIDARVGLGDSGADRTETVALVYGLREVARNMREIDAAICAIAAKG